MARKPELAIPKDDMVTAMVQDESSFSHQISSSPTSSSLVSASNSTLSRKSGSSRVVKANHLLNFQGPGATTHGSEMRRGGSSLHRRRGEGGSGSAIGKRPGGKSRTFSRYQVYDRAKFLQANFRFLVSNMVNISRYEAEADLMLDWDDVLAVVMLNTTPISCPISLENPWCPQITPCGHVFSFPSIIAHIMSHGGGELKGSAPCPLCAALVTARELRPVHLRSVEELKNGNFVTLRLLKREKNSIIADVVGDRSGNRERQIGNSSKQGPVEVEAGSPWASESSNPANKVYNGNTINESADYFMDKEYLLPRYSKFKVLENPMELWIAEARHLATRAAILLREGGMEANYEVPPLLAAIDLLADRAKAWSEKQVKHDFDIKCTTENNDVHLLMLRCEKAGKEAKNAIRIAAEEATRDAEHELQKQHKSEIFHRAFPALISVKTSSSLEIQEEKAVEGSPGCVVRTSDSKTESSFGAVEQIQDPEDTDLYFYQCIDGQWAFLCPLNMKMIDTYYGSAACYPSTITAPILEIEKNEQSIKTRKRFPALSHLPLTSNFTFLEVDLKETLPSDVLSSFSHELSSRSRRRAQIEKREARQRKAEAARALSGLQLKHGGPSESELASMPLPSASRLKAGHQPDSDSEEKSRYKELERESIKDFDQDKNETSAVPIPGTSFATIARLGFAATGPVLGNSPPSLGQSPGTKENIWSRSPVGTSSSWPKRQTESSSAVWSMDKTSSPRSITENEASGKKKKSGRKILLSSAHRKY